jgi:hypothetical protein
MAPMQLVKNNQALHNQTVCTKQPNAKKQLKTQTANTMPAANHDNTKQKPQ